MLQEKEEPLCKRPRSEDAASSSSTAPAAAVPASQLELAARGSGKVVLGFLAGNGDTALHVAASGGELQAVLALLGAGARVDAVGHRLRTPLHCAVAHGHLAVAQRLLDAGASVHVKNVDGVAPVELAATGTKEMVELLVEGGVSIDACNENGEPLLVQAAKAKRWEIVRYLLGKGACPTKCKSAAECALVLASQDGQADAVRHLLRAGAASNAEQLKAALQGATSAAVVWAFVEAVPHMVLGEAGRWGLLFAARDGHVEALVALLEAGVDVNVRDSISGTALYYASANGHLACVQTLLKRGADADAKDKDGRAALHWAAQEGHAACVRGLLAAGASAADRDKQGKTPLELAPTDEVRAAFDDQ